MSHQTPDTISIAECRPRWLYRIAARNFRLGVFNAENSGFIGIREKFGSEFLFTEYHWDTGAPFGTVIPHEALEPIPDDMLLSTDNPALFQWLLERRAKNTDDN